MMFSATFPRAARRLAVQHMANDYAFVRVGRIGSTHKNITQRVCVTLFFYLPVMVVFVYLHNTRPLTIAKKKMKLIWTDEKTKKTAVYDLILSHRPARTMIFVNTKRMVDILDDYLYNLRLPTTSVHSDRTQREREDAL
jgi:ATP-dependent RNA helicase DDX3X